MSSRSAPPSCASRPRKLPSSLLNIFKLVFLALLWLFFLRVLRAVWVSVREPEVVAGGGGGPAAAPVTGVKRGEAPASPGSLKVVEPGEQRGRLYPLGNEVTIGRGGGCGVALADDRM